MTNIQRDTHSIDNLQEHSAELISNVHQLRQEFTRLRETSVVLRGESIQLRDDSRKLRIRRDVK